MIIFNMNITNEYKILKKLTFKNLRYSPDLMILGPSFLPPSSLHASNAS